MKYLGWGQLIAGIWVLVSPWVAGFSAYSLGKWSNIISGMLIIIVALWQLFGDDYLNPPDMK